MEERKGRCIEERKGHCIEERKGHCMDIEMCIGLELLF